MFQVAATNLNGEGARSIALEQIACIPPKGVSPPKRVSTTSTGATLEWSKPTDDGGCGITSYWLLRDNGDAGQSS